MSNQISTFFKISACVLILGLYSCNESTPQKQTSTGKPFEIFVVMNNALWKGAIGDTLRSIMQEEVPMLNQNEPLYSLYYIEPSNYKGIMSRHRNVLSLRISADYKEPKMTAVYDVDARPQIVVNITGPSDSIVLSYIDENRTALQKIFEITERDRFVARAKKFTDNGINETIEKMFGFKMNVPKGYRIRKTGENFIWVSYEMPIISEGFFIYSYPLTSAATFTEPELIDMRNKFAKEIPGPSGKSYMTTNMELMPQLSQFRISGRLWVELRGFWDVYGDYMGGPFISFTTADATRKQVITIDGYVYSPKYPKRNYIRQLESLIFTAEFPSDTTSTITIAKPKQ